MSTYHSSSAASRRIGAGAGSRQPGGTCPGRARHRDRCPDTPPSCSTRPHHTLALGSQMSTNKKKI